MTLRVDNQPFDGALADLQAGQMVEIRCESELGNPVASLHLTKNGISFGPVPRSSYIAHTFMVTALDSGSVLGCTAIENQNNWSADSQTVELNVLCKYKYVHMILTSIKWVLHDIEKACFSWSSLSFSVLKISGFDYNATLLKKLLLRISNIY